MHRPFARPVIAGLCTIAASLSFAAEARALTGREVMEKADKANRAKDEEQEATMTIIDPRGLRRVRQMTIFQKAASGDDDNILIRFTAPPDMRGTGLLTLEEGDDDKQWLYLPDLRKSRRIAGSSKANSFVGSDFSNYDMRTEDLANHEYQLLGEKSIEGRACYEIESTPKDDETREETGYSKRVILVDKEWWVVHEVRFFDRNGKALKTLRAQGFRPVEGLYRPKVIVMDNEQERSRTVLAESSPRKINKGISDGKFTKRELERP